MGDKVKPNSITAKDNPEWDYFESDEWYLAKFEEVETGDGKFGQYLKFKFTVLNGQTESGKAAKGKPINALINADLCSSQPLWGWVKVMTGKEPVVGKDYDLTAYYGEKFRILITDRKQKKGETRRFQTIKTIKRREVKEKGSEE